MGGKEMGRTMIAIIVTVMLCGCKTYVPVERVHNTTDTLYIEKHDTLRVEANHTEMSDKVAEREHIRRDSVYMVVDEAGNVKKTYEYHYLGDKQLERQILALRDSVNYYKILSEYLAEKNTNHQQDRVVEKLSIWSMFKPWMLIPLLITFIAAVYLLIRNFIIHK
jgi:hypothetical protein